MNVILTETLQLYGDDENLWLQAQHLPLNNAEFKIIEHRRKIHAACMGIWTAHCYKQDIRHNNFRPRKTRIKKRRNNGKINFIINSATAMVEIVNMEEAWYSRINKDLQVNLV